MLITRILEQKTENNLQDRKKKIKKKTIHTPYIYYIYYTARGTKGPMNRVKKLRTTLDQNTQQELFLYCNPAGWELLPYRAVPPFSKSLITIFQETST